jgi:hypothetical protein
MDRHRVEVLRVEFGADGEPSQVTVCGKAGRVEVSLPASVVAGGVGRVTQRSVPLRGRASQSLAHAQLAAPGLTLSLEPPKRLTAQAGQAAAATVPTPSAVQRLRQRVAELMGVGESFGAANEALAAAEAAEAAGAAGAEAARGATEAEASGEAAVGSDLAALGRVARAWDPAAAAHPAVAPAAANVELVASLLHLSGGWVRLRSVQGPCAAAKNVALQAAAAAAAAAAADADTTAAVAVGGGIGGGFGFGSGASQSPAVAAPAVPFVRPGLYVGAYGDQYGQHKHEVLLVEYRRFAVTALDVTAEGWQSCSSSSVWSRVWREVFDGRADPHLPWFGTFNTPRSCAMLGRVKDLLATHLAHLALEATPAESPGSGSGRSAPSSPPSDGDRGAEGSGHGAAVRAAAGGGAPPLAVEVVFCVGRKVTGDAHVPAGAASWGALCSPAVPPEPPTLARAGVDAERSERGFPGFVAAQTVVGRHDHARVAVHRAWPGWGTLAYPGFDRPSWSDGQLCQLGGGKETGDSGGVSAGSSGDGGGRFAFMWERQESQPATVLNWLAVQQEHPFVNSV